MSQKDYKISIYKSLIPIIFLTSLLFFNILFFENNDWFGEYTFHYIILLSALTALLIGVTDNVKFSKIIYSIIKNIKSILTPVIILFLVGALAGTWKVSGIIPAMVYYGLDMVSYKAFLPITLLVSMLVSLTTGSSYTTSATVGIALVAVGIAFNIPAGMTAGAVISGAYFGDKMSPLSDTTNLAPAITETNLYTHIRYMTYTTFPTFIITLICFVVIGFNLKTTNLIELNDISTLSTTILNDFHISPILFVVPLLVIFLAFLKFRPVIVLLIGIIGASILALIFQNDILQSINQSNLHSIFQAIFTDTEIHTENLRIERLYSSGGMKGMLWTIYLTIAAMVFGGCMDAIGALNTLTKSLLNRAKSNFDLFLSTAASCLGVNIIASDQYLAIVIPGKMFKKAFKKKKLSSENLSRTLEDTGTVTSALIPWNTCGAYHYGVLGVSVFDYFIYAIFNWLSPITTLLYAAMEIKIKKIKF
ncbi:MAG: Na+/H+ antiporter NhaC [Flavobacteriaceae bacterium]|tara:strand:+ start:482 stop:1912 length:1431 start_codon:yes stop_codon:yes gene_type:complete